VTKPWGAAMEGHPPLCRRIPRFLVSALVTACMVGAVLAGCFLCARIKLEGAWLARHLPAAPAPADGPDAAAAAAHPSATAAHNNVNVSVEQPLASMDTAEWRAFQALRAARVLPAAMREPGPSWGKLFRNTGSLLNLALVMLFGRIYSRVSRVVYAYALGRRA
jgi:hypothetical protein